eukprot:CAMPEP_0119308500 /NCGR_PEP_ID=MMETSP1333-20130426/11370_1 /TAXON_ID=418940 /ORGANISM="Scyphosphaera apsteinii, Strain RCC1455" /LENGTH=138 /DNA_ID=CAMNT_0007312291 /DNA_START=40 /DNA_END=456 /DNA_ORIENTATION=+
MSQEKYVPSALNDSPVRVLCGQMEFLKDGLTMTESKSKIKEEQIKAGTYVEPEPVIVELTETEKRVKKMSIHDQRLLIAVARLAQDRPGRSMTVPAAECYKLAAEALDSLEAGTITDKYGSLKEVHIPRAVKPRANKA